MKQFDFTRDYHSYANTDDVKVTHFDLSLAISFEHKHLSGFVVLTLQHQSDTPSTGLTLDSRGLLIDRIEDSQGQPLSYQLFDADNILGSRLHIDIPNG